MLQFQLDRLKNEARAALESYLDRLTLPELQGFDPTRPLELTLHASLRTSGPLPLQTLELVATPLQTHKVTNLLTSGATPEEPEKIQPLEAYVSSEDLIRLDDLLKS